MKVAFINKIGIISFLSGLFIMMGSSLWMIADSRFDFYREWNLVTIVSTLFMLAYGLMMLSFGIMLAIKYKNQY